MIEKLQAWGLAAKNFFLWILAPLLFVAGCVLLLWKKEKDLENELAETKADQKLQELKDAQKPIDAAADTAVNDYTKLLSEYNDAANVSAGPSGVRKSGGGAEDTSDHS